VVLKWFHGDNFTEKQGGEGILLGISSFYGIILNPAIGRCFMRMHKLLFAAALCAVSSVAFAQVILPEGTRVRVRLEQTISSATAEEGQSVNLSVADDVKIGDTIVVPQGSACIGTITSAIPKRRMGRTGKLDLSMERVVAVDGTSIPLRYSPTKKEGGSKAGTTGALTAGAAIVFWPAAPVFLLMKGKDVTINRGIIFDVFTDQRFTLNPRAATIAPAGATTVQPAQLVTTPGPASTPAAPPPPPPATVTITSEPAGADIELDGTFIGNTPTTLQMAPGPHSFLVKKGSATWTRTVQIQPGGTITLSAPLSGKR
jgi:hypothetical protein